MRNTDKHSAAVIIVSFIPFGYSGSSDSLSSAGAPWIAVSSTVFSAWQCGAETLSTVGSAGGFSKSEVEVVAVDGSLVGAIVEGSI